MNQRNEAFAEVEALTRTVDKLDERLDQIDRLAGRSMNSSTANVKLDMGGAGVWIAATCCVIMLAVTLGLTAMLIDHSRQIGRMQDHLTAIYMMAPHLKPDQDLKNSR